MQEQLEETVSAGKKEGLGLAGLIAVVFSSMVGGGIFNIAQNMASVAGLGAVILAWVVTGLGMVFLVLTFKVLSDDYPDLREGMYQYARVGFGNYVGFNIAWGYWLCVALGNVAFVVMLNDAVGAFFPVLLEHNWESIIFCLGVVWTMYAIVIQGIMTASFINTLMTVLKLGAIVIIIALLVVYLRVDLLFEDFWGESLAAEGYMSGIWSQMSGTMFVTIFCFVGIEGGVMLSGYARSSHDVGKASVIGFYLALIIYAAISILCFGIRSREELAAMLDPSVAYVLRAAVGEGAYYFVIVTVIVSILAAFISWTMLAAQAPYGAARADILPERLKHTNRHDVPVFGLTLTTLFMSGFIVLVCTAPDVYLAALNLTTVMVLPAYALCGAFLWKMARRGGKAFVGFCCLLYCGWCVFAGGAWLFLASSILYLAGFYFYYVNFRRRKREGRQQVLLTLPEKVLFAVIVAASAVSIVFISLGRISLN